ncbi:hypothetical protein Trydic_g11663 [Trypoxylus dichotomus]
MINLASSSNFIIGGNKVEGKLSNIFRNNIPTYLKRKAFNWAHIRKEDLRRRTGVNDVVNLVANLKWNWAGHVVRLRSRHWMKLLSEWRPREDKRSRGRQPTPWTYGIKRMINNWIQAAQNIIKWNRIGDAYVHQWTQRTV